MKRKYLSALLMGVLTLSSVSTFTSCKDYDDDISNLQGQIDKLATADQLSQKVAELQALISSNKSDITSLQAELAKKTTLDEVKAVLADYATKQYVDAADKTLQDAIDALKTGDIAKLKEDVVKAQAAADKAAADAEKANADIVETLKTLATKTELQDAADAAQKAIEALESKNAEDLKKAQEAITETLKNYAEEGDKKTLESLAETIKNASDALTQANTNKQAIADALDILGKGYSKENTVAAAIEAIKGQIGTPNKELGTLDSRLAAIESVLNGVKDDDTKLGLATKVTNIENKLKDIIGEYTTMVTEVSLVGSVLDNGDLNTPTAGAYQLQFISGEVKKNYTFGKDEAYVKELKITVENQQKFVEHTPFNDQRALVVRVNPTNAVLTKASIKLVDSQGNDLNDVLEIGEPKQYTELLTRASKGTGLWTIPVNVKAGVASDKIEQLAKNNKHILYAVAIKNTETPKDAEDRYVASTYDITVPKATPFDAPANINDVHIWSESTMTEKGAISLSDAKETTKANVGKLVRAKNDETINIDFKNYGGKIKYFYVVRDDKNTDTSSDQSELNAWKGYKYDGTAYGKVIAVDPKNPGTLKINIGGTSVADDEIGFRVFAIDYEGTVVNANGNSFVVYVGDEQTKSSVAGSLAVTKKIGDATEWLPLTGKLKDGTTLPGTWSTKVGDKTITFKVSYSKDGKDAAPAGTNNSEIKFVKFATASDVVEWKDNLKAEGKITTLNAKKLVENEISVSLTKVLPNVESTKKLMGYTWKDGQLVDGTYTAYVYPVDKVWTSLLANGQGKNGFKAFKEAITGLGDNCVIKVANLSKDDKDKYTVAKDFNTTPWNVEVDNALIDGTTKHATNISYNYGKISSDTKKDGAIVDYVITVETVQTIFANPLKKGVQNYNWGKATFGTGKNAKEVDVNYLTYNNESTVKVTENGIDKDANLLDYIIGHNDFDNDVFGGKLSTLAKEKYVSVDAKLISNGSKKEDYFKAKVVNGVISFEAKSGTTNPVKDVASTLIITVKDAFGNTYEYPMDFTVKRTK